MNSPSSVSLEDAAATAWRTQTRKDLISRRLSTGHQERAHWSVSINQHLLQKWPDPPGQAIAFCWPYKAEHDLRAVIKHWIAKGALAAMPVVVAQKSPLVFRQWQVGAEMQAGALGIPIPVGGREIRPDTILLPANGFDGSGYRLGYGAGYFDRTIAGLRPDVRVIGIAYEIGRLESIRPQWHDQPMDAVVTEAGVQICR